MPVFTRERWAEFEMRKRRADVRCKFDAFPRVTLSCDISRTSEVLIGFDSAGMEVVQIAAG